MTSPRHIILSQSLGVYLGNCMGLGFWSKLDPVDQPSAVTFQSVAEAQRFLSTWECLEHLPADLSYPEVVPDDGDYASHDACVAAGAEPWEYRREVTG